MATASDLDCDLGGRRAQLLAEVEAGVPITGIDYIEVDPGNQRRIEVYFLGEVPDHLATGHEPITILGGRRVPVRVVRAHVEMTGDGRPCLVVEADQPGDFSDYVLEIENVADDESGGLRIDELFRRCEFNFKVACPTRFDCAPRGEPAPTAEDSIDIDYLAKDYASFRRALLDLIPNLAPQWTERLAADLGITVLELLAYAGDQLSYYQDAVANEAFLETARQRISVRRHARLVDYSMHDGSSARAFVHVAIDEGRVLVLDVDKDPPDPPLELLTHITEPIGARPPAPTIPEGDRPEAIALAEAVFATSTGGRLHHQLNEIALYDWGNDRCSLPAGSRTADLDGDLTGILEEDDFLLLEEVRDPRTGVEGLADRTHRQVVRLTGVRLVVDNLRGRLVTRVTWAEADALGFRLWVTGSTEQGARLEAISVARGNVLLADHGFAVQEEGLVADPVVSGTRAARFRLNDGPLGFRHPEPRPGQPAADLLRVDPGEAVPQVTRVASGTEASDIWQPRTSLIGADRFARVFALETGNGGEAHLRFGDGVFGMAPPAGATFDVDYRVGIGREGHVGADALAHVVTDPAVSGIAAVRNPLPAWGGTEPESMTRVKQVAPAAFRARQHRAVTQEDYAEVAMRHPRVRNAVAQFRWTGSWHTVFVSIDPAGGADLSTLAGDVEEHVASFALAGYDLRIVPPHYVPLDVELEICVDPAHFPADVAEAVHDALSSGLQPSGSPGFFHPDRFTFGQPLRVSRLYAAVATVDGVESVIATRFARLAAGEAGAGRSTEANLARGAIRPGPLKILRLDDDPDFPENGLLRLDMKGGK